MAILRRHLPANRRSGSGKILGAGAKRALREAQKRGEGAKPHIAAMSGPAISVAAASVRLSCGPKAVRDMIARNQLVGYRSLTRPQHWLLPRWQFGQHGRRERWVAELIAAYGANGWALMNFVALSRAHLAGRSYLHLLRDGKVDRVLAAAKRTNPD